MKKELMAFAVAFAAPLAFCAAEGASHFTIADFTDPSVATGASLVARDGTAELKPTPDGLRVVFCGAEKGAMLSVATIAERIAAMKPEKRPGELYLKYRVRRLDDAGGGWIHLSTSDEDTPYSIRYGLFRRTGNVETARIRPGILARRNGVQFCPRSMKDAAFAFCGSGDIDVIEFGGIEAEPEKTPRDALLPHVDSEAFALYPEPRIFRDTGRTVPFSQFGSSFRIVGDVPPGPVAQFKNDMRAFYDINFSESDDAKVEFAVSDDYAIDGYDGIKFDGFAIDIGEACIRVAAKEQKGLLFGVQVLLDIIKMSTGDVGEPKARLCTVVDWPRMGMRIVGDCFVSWRTKYDPDFFADVVERFPLRQSRLNTVVIAPRMRYRYECAPFIPVRPECWTRAEFEHVVDRFNANAVTVVPRLYCLSHVGGWPIYGRKEAALYGEDGDGGHLCTRSQAAQKILADSCSEVLDICSRNPKYAPKHFHISMDECRWNKTAATPPEKRCPRCAGVPKRRLFLEQVIRMRDWCRTRGLHTVMYADMVRAYHNGLDRWKCHEIEGEIPKDIIYDNWSSWDFFEIPETTTAGHGNWKTLTGFKDDPEAEEYVEAGGLGIFTSTWWLAPGRSHDMAPYGLMAQRILGDFLWRNPPEVGGGDGGTVTGRVGDGLAKVRRWGDFIIRNWSRKPIPRGAATFASVDISPTATLPLSASFDIGTKALSGVPVSLVVREGRVMAAEANHGGIAFNVGRKVASVAFLHVATVPEESREAYYSNTNYLGLMTGPLIAEYRVEYADGTSATAEVRFGWNATEYRSKSTLFSVFARYPAECRAILTGALPKQDNLLAPNTGVAAMYEWVNPSPEKVLKSLTLVRRDGIARYAVIAISVRNVKSAQQICAMRQCNFAQ